jgi:hypothetical protein
MLKPVLRTDGRGGHRVPGAGGEFGGPGGHGSIGAGAGGQGQKDRAVGAEGEG